jgi:hypothetical protein
MFLTIVQILRRTVVNNMSPYLLRSFNFLSLRPPPAPECYVLQVHRADVLYIKMPILPSLITQMLGAKFLSSTSVIGSNFDSLSEN